MSTNSSYRVSIHEPREPAAELVCFHHAGGGSRFFQGWKETFDAELAISAALLPGRERRFGESVPEQLDTVADAITDEIASGAWPTRRPLVLFGHSLGAMLGYEVAHRLEAKGVEVAHYFASGRGAPTAEHAEKIYHQLSDEKLLDELREMGGTPSKVLEEPDLMELYLPIIRSDFALVERYEREEFEVLAAPISAVGGAEDDDLSESDLEEWSELTEGAFAYRLFPGGHFYLEERQSELLEWIEQRLRETGLLDAAT